LSATLSPLSGLAFDFEVCSDHYSPWLMSQGHSPYAWSVLSTGNLSGRVGHLRHLPDHRLRPGSSRAKAATLQLLSEARSILDLVPDWDPEEHRAISHAHDQFRWFGGGWAVNADAPTPAGFEGANKFVRPEDAPLLDRLRRAVGSAAHPRAPGRGRVLRLRPIGERVDTQRSHPSPPQRDSNRKGDVDHGITGS
jgi:hypothetical protein